MGHEKKGLSSVLKEILAGIKKSGENLKEIDSELKKFTEKLEKNLKKLNINAEVFIGGSFAKKTMMNRKPYDVDIFVRFRKGGGDISCITGKALEGFEGVETLHGSRNYFRTKIKNDMFFEIIPVMKVSSPKQAENITDLSYFHVKYIKNKIKSGKIIDEILLAKKFCYANNCYGAESYINGFSGYALELLIYNYKSFLNFARSLSKERGKIIIDMEKFYRNKQELMMNLNSSKLKSPIILIDPTYKQRNALASLSEETFGKFQKACREFLKNPSEKFFEIKKIDFDKIEKDAKRKKYEFIVLTTKTDRQEGDIAGSKLLKFHRHLKEEIKKYFDVKDEGFEYDSKKSSKSFFAVKSKKEILIRGPRKENLDNVINFRKEHKNTFEKSGRIFAKEKIKANILQFIELWKKKNQKKTSEMSIENIDAE